MIRSGEHLLWNAHLQRTDGTGGKGAAIAAWAEQTIRHPDGQPLRLDPWQAEVLAFLLEDQP